MPVSFCPAPHNDIKQASGRFNPLTSDSVSRVLSHLRSENTETIDELLQSSLIPRDATKIKVPPSSSSDLSTNIVMESFNPQQHGLVQTVIDAYNRHHALVLRPDDIWLCILTQFSLFVNGPGRAEALRSQFVHHDAKEKLVVRADGTRYTVDFGRMAEQMTTLIEEKLADPVLRDWILPSFTTTTPNDTTVASIVMMATFKSYFDYEFVTECGIPRVTLLGDRSDWEDILARIERLKEYAPETKTWYRLLQPVLRRFVLAFDEGYAESSENLEFWQRVAHYVGGGSGETTYVRGWIAAFGVFDSNGEWIGGNLDQCDEAPVPSTSVVTDNPSIIYEGEYEEMYDEYDGEVYRSYEGKAPVRALLLDGVTYHWLDADKLPTTYMETPVLLRDNGEEFDARLLAGLIGTTVTDSGVNSGVQDQVSPVAGWFIFTVKEGRKEFDSEGSEQDAEFGARR